MDILIPIEPMKLTLAGVTISFSRDLEEGGFVVVTSDKVKEKLTLPQCQALIQSLSGFQTVVSSAIRLELTKG